MEYKYAIGQQVKVRADLQVHKNYNMFYTKESNMVNRSMHQMGGKTVTIAARAGRQYRIEEDEGEWRWTDDMFEDEEMNVLEKRFLDKRIMNIKETEDKTVYGHHQSLVYLDDGEVYQVAVVPGLEKGVHDSKIIKLKRKIIDENEVIVAELNVADGYLIIPLK